MSDGQRFIADELERMLGLPLQPKEALQAWYEEARKLQRTLRERHPGIEIPHEIWHFFFDADIRSREHEAGYRELQEGLVREFIDSLRGGGRRAS